MTVYKTQKGGIKIRIPFTKKKDNEDICNTISKKNKEISLITLSTYNFYKIVEIFEVEIKEKLSNKNMEDLKTYNLSNQIYEECKIHLKLDMLYTELYKYYITKTKSKISKSTFFSLMTKYFKIVILYNIAKKILNLLFSFKRTGYNNVNRNRGKLLTEHNETLYDQLEIDLNNKIVSFLRLEKIDCTSYKMYKNIFTSHIDNLLGMYDRIQIISRKKLSVIQSQSRNSRNTGYSTNSSNSNISDFVSNENYNYMGPETNV